MLYALNSEFPSDGRHISNVKLIADARWYRSIENQLKTINYFSYITDGLKINLISFTKPIFNLDAKKYNELLGFVKIDVDPSQIFDIESINQPVRNISDIYIFDKAVKVIYRNGSTAFLSDSMNIREKITSGRSGMEVIEENIQRQILVYKKIPQYEFNLCHRRLFESYCKFNRSFQELQITGKYRILWTYPVQYRRYM